MAKTQVEAGGACGAGGGGGWDSNPTAGGDLPTHSPFFIICILCIHAQRSYAVSSSSSVSSKIRNSSTRSLSSSSSFLSSSFWCTFLVFFGIAIKSNTSNRTNSGHIFKISTPLFFIISVY